jgi:hypothetical protein
MFKILKYLKKSIVPIIAIVILLVVQAVCDLSLPDYTAKIVDVGIQQGGIETALPDVIRKSEMDKILLFMDDANKDMVLRNYTLLDKSTLGTAEYQEYISKYPLLADEALYQLNEIEQETVDGLNEILGKSILIVSGIETGSDEITAMTNQLKATFPVGALPEDATIFDMLSLMPDEQRAQIFVRNE